MIFNRSLVREFGQIGLIVGSILLVILLSSGAIRLLGRAAGGKLAPDAVTAMLAFASINYLPILLTLALFIAVLLTLSRCYRDSEMVVWQTAGKSLLGWVRPVLWCALPMVLLIGYLTTSLSPWAQRRSAEYLSQLDTRHDVSLVTPGVFIESRRADRVFFVEAVSTQDNTVGNVFVQSVRDGKVAIVTAARGYQETNDKGDSMLVLQQGRYYRGVPGTAEFGIVDFERYTMKVEPRQAAAQVASPRALSTRELLRQPTPNHLAELHWRLSLPISALVLALLAVPLSYVNPRAGRSVNLLIAVLVFVIYYNFNTVIQAWIAQSKISPWLGLWIVHALMLGAVAIAFLHRMSPRMPFVRWWYARTPKTAGA